MSLLQIEPASSPAPRQPLVHLDALWLQVAGTVCNLRCTHCFVSCGPANHSHTLMSRDEVRAHVEDALALGVRELYFTGGEPFLHPEMSAILDDCLPLLPCTVLTNGTLFTPGRLAALARASEGSRHSLELRVSLDGWKAEDHDRLRGEGTFERTLAGLVAADRAGLVPIVAVTHAIDEDTDALVGRYQELLRGVGIARPRLKLLPLFRLGREAMRTRSYEEPETLIGLSDEALDPERLQCGHSRAVTTRGVYVCPLLVEEPRAHMGARLTDALGSFPLFHGACFTCHRTGMTCANH